MKIKKILCIILLGCICLSFTGCTFKIAGITFYFGAYNESGYWFYVGYPEKETAEQPENEDEENSLLDQSTANEEDSSTGLIIIWGNHANSKKFDLNAEFKTGFGLEKLIMDSIATTEENGKIICRADVSIIVNDSSPGEVGIDSSKLVGTIGSWDYVKQEKNKMVKEIWEYITDDKNYSKFIADNEGADLLASLSVAASIIKSRPEKNYRIIVYDTGICTSGAINMLTQVNMMEQSIDSIIENIDKSGGYGICDLNKAKVFIPYLLNTSDAQDKAYLLNGESNSIYDDDILKNKFDDLWTEIVKQCNGIVESNEDINVRRFADAEDMIYSDDGDKSVYKEVPIVTFSRRIEGYTGPEVLIADSRTLTFKEDSAEFKYGKEAAENSLSTFKESWVSYANSDKNHIFYVVGSVARDFDVEPKDRNEWSEKRAKAVAGILKEFGIPDDQIKTVDAGTLVLKGWRDADEFHDGRKTADEDTQAKNRVVAIIPNDRNNEECVKMMDTLREALKAYNRTMDD